VLINTTYRGSPVGTGVYTRNLLEALPEARTIRLPERMVAAHRYAHWGKRAAEVMMAAVPGRLVHPYWSVDRSSRHVVSALDTVQYREASSTERALLRSAARHCGGLLSLSEWSAASVADDIGRRPVVAPPFSDAPWYDEPLAPPPSGARLRIAFWGGFHPRKRFAEFLHALEVSPLRDDVTVLTSGSFAGSSPVDVESRGHLTTPELVAMVDSCHLTVFPSTEEGWGLPIAESLLRERPVLCSDLPVYREFATGQGLTPVADWSDPECLEQAITRAQHPVSRSAALIDPHRGSAVSRLRQAVQDVLET
jgi:Glycosyl transferases group 1